jgi:hypothetical protein
MLRPGDIVVIDNLGSHNGKTIRASSVRLVPGCCY